MFNYYVFSESYEKSSIEAIELNLKDLNDLVIDERNIEDSFLINDSIWEIQTADGIFSEVIFSNLSDKQFSYSVLPKMLQAIETIQKKIVNFEQFDKEYQLYNAFYGINFCELGLDLKRCISDKAEYIFFRQKYLWELTATSLWERKDSLFFKIIFCESVENNLKAIGSTYLKQIVAKLKDLDNYVKANWINTNEPFNYYDANQKTSLNISPESKKTIDQQKYYNQRIFSMPDGRRELFELHIKTGNLRFHFLPENGIIYIGYIGTHLDTDLFN